MYDKAIAEGYSDTVCSECGQVFLAFHHFVRCTSGTCPMVVREQDGTRSPSILHQLLGGNPWCWSAGTQAPEQSSAAFHYETENMQMV